MDAVTAKTKLVQADLLENVSDMLKAIACMDDGAAPRISEIVVLVDKLTTSLEQETETPNVTAPQTCAPILTVV